MSRTRYTAEFKAEAIKKVVLIAAISSRTPPSALACPRTVFMPVRVPPQQSGAVQGR